MTASFTLWLFKMKNLLFLTLALAIGWGLPHASGQESSEKTAALKVLLVAGGCCHDYATQTQLLKKGIEERMNAVVTVEFNPSKGTDATFKIYESDDWAKGYDVVIHDECSASVMDRPYVNRILDAHRQGVPAVNLHCAMHSYRWGDFREPVELGADNAAWYEMLGIQSTGHGAQAPIEICFVATDHPVTRGLENWTTINEELYNNVRVFGNTEVLATGNQLMPPNKKELKDNPSAKPKQSTAVVAWTNEFGPKKTKIFSTTLGHNNETVGDSRYLDLVVRGIKWTTGK
jgi:type 1 glutamine amidotransferase